jgi:hypothetical protein
MLHRMQPKAESVSPSAPTDFAGLLAALAMPAQKNAAAWNGGVSADELASVSYEKALRTPRKPQPVQQEAQKPPRRAPRPAARRASPAEEPEQIAETDSAASVRAALQQAIAALGRNTEPEPVEDYNGAVHTSYSYDEPPASRQWIKRPLAGKLEPEPEPEPEPMPTAPQSSAERLRTLLAEKIAEQRAAAAQRPSIHARPVPRTAPKLEKLSPAESPTVRRVAARPQTARRMEAAPSEACTFAGTIESVLNPEIEAPEPQRMDSRATSRIERPLSGALAPRGLVAVKNASITIRMSAAECEQLRGRAAEAGMTVSAYLRSCIFEVEGLRAQVKAAVAQIRSTAAPAEAAYEPAHYAASDAAAAGSTALAYRPAVAPGAEQRGWLGRMRSFLFGAPQTT